jgi:pSer/pThr/pTyr-binding forkhead associated (FHA) protein
MTKVTLEIIEGPGAGQRLLGTLPIEIGRDGTAQFTINDTLVSWRHARIVADDSGPAIEDLGSRNGTFVNDQPIRSPTSLRPNDTILVGVTVLRLCPNGERPQQMTGVITKPAPMAATPRPAPAPVAVPGLDPLLDIHTKGKARTAPLAIFVLVALAVIIFLAWRR